jgi:hypothetical protein
VNSANVESALGATESGSDSSTATTRTGGAGTGVWTICTVTWAATQSEQSVWVTASAWVCATWAVPAIATKKTQSSARRNLHEPRVVCLVYFPLMLDQL